MSKPVRCAIYTRKSTEEGLQQDFNSLDAQREASEAYIKSQQHEGWVLVPTPYDDGGYSGGTMERPALKQLLSDIQVGKIDVVVVYKVDRLSRALNDFARMVEIFDKHAVSFVSVTQSFNTTSSMGRLTLNVLLSFAQFEREVTGERIRDKFAASKKKGIWMGGRPPLGYDVKHRKLIVNEKEASSIRLLFKAYLHQPADEPFRNILDSLKKQGVTNKSYVTQKCKQRVGGPLTMTQLYKMLRNPIYNGKLRHKERLYDGEHEAIIENALWHAVQDKLNENAITRSAVQKTDGPAFVGKLFDYKGHKYGPTYSYKYSENSRYKMRYYVNRSSDTHSEALKRIRADYLDAVIQEATRGKIETLIGLVRDAEPSVSSALLAPLEETADNVKDTIDKIVLHPKHLEVSFSVKTRCRSGLRSWLEAATSKDMRVSTDASAIHFTCNMPVTYRKAGGQLHIVNYSGEEESFDAQAKACFPDDKTFTFVAKGFYWSKCLERGEVSTIAEIAKRDHHSSEYVKKALKARFLSPEILRYICSNDMETQISVEKLVRCNAWEWKKQSQDLL